MNLQSRAGGKRVRLLGETDMSLRPKVSVIVASYNCHEVIENALESVFEQSFLNKELIVVDGGSTDGTVDILGNHENQIDYWVSENDNGVYEALNKGISIAHGEWLYFLGSDDCLRDPHVLERVFNRELNAKLVYGDVVLSGNGPVGRHGVIYDGVFSKLKLCYRNICQQAIFYHKSLFEELGGFSLNYPVLADREFNIKVFANYSNETRHIDEVIAVYNTEGMSSAANGDNLEKELPEIVRRELGLKYFLHLKLSRIYNSVKGKLHFHIVRKLKKLNRLR